MDYLLTDRTVGTVSAGTTLTQTLAFARKETHHTDQHFGCTGNSCIKWEWRHIIIFTF